MIINDYYSDNNKFLNDSLYSYITYNLQFINVSINNSKSPNYKLLLLYKL